ncbi:MAG: hypothetical protein DRQ37_06175, partial [Gammaproteobacteria bacterium]
MNKASSAAVDSELRVQDFAENPAPVLETAFEDIYQQRMTDLPVVNTSLSVAAVGFERWEGMWLGALLTPWFLNLILLPQSADDWSTLPQGKKRKLKLPSGNYAFTGGYEESIGNYLFCSLASPMHSFPDHAAALKTAHEVMELLLQPTAEDEDGNELDPDSKTVEPFEGKPTVSRRGFLRG